MSNTQQPDWHVLAARSKVSGHAFINGVSSECEAAPFITSTNPADGSEGFRCVNSTPAQVDAAVTAARAAYEGEWGRFGPAQRRAVLFALANAIEKHGSELAICDSLDIGKPVSAAAGEVFPAAGFIRYYAESIDKIHSGMMAPTGMGALEMQMWRPRGVVGAITPWNFPLINACFKLGPALAAGNTVVIKPSELSPRSTLLLAKIASEAGIPNGVINVVPGDGATGAALVEHSGVDMLTFTGSTTTGKSVLRGVGGSTIKPVLLECGGKSPEILFEDIADLGVAEIAAQVVQGAFWNQGQVCVARSRILVHHSLYGDMVEAVVAAAQAITPGDPLDPATSFGPLASARQRDIVEQYIQWGIDDGARLVLDGRKPSGFDRGCYVGPTVFADVPSQSRIAREEIFGPVLCLMPFADEAEALALANDTDYGLAATIWTRDIARANRMANAVQAGNVRVVASLAPVEGAGFCHSAEPCSQSGYGVEGGPNGMRSYMRQQSIEWHMG